MGILCHTLSSIYGSHYQEKSSEGRAIYVSLQLHVEFAVSSAEKVKELKVTAFCEHRECRKRKLTNDAEKVSSVNDILYVVLVGANLLRCNKLLALCRAVGK